MQAAGDIAASEITPITDVRGAAEYRTQLTRNILLKFFYQTQDRIHQGDTESTETMQKR